MNTALFVVGLFSTALLTGCATSQPVVEKGHSFHTTPDKWTESRIFHTSTENHMGERLRQSMVPYDGRGREDVIYSPNKAYWFSSHDISPDDESKGARFIEIFSERPYLVRIEFHKHYKIFEPDVRWINQKLLYIEVWWGRVVGTYLMYDVEKEEVLIAESVHDGRIAFQQWQEAKHNTQPEKSSAIR
ncbi:MAG: hypothetical protein PF795_01895 [Kiritimatiellae bacterium]|nr:hypothetical protein [Kiritimatiellia bacterium]